MLRYHPAEALFARAKKAHTGRLGSASIMPIEARGVYEDNRLVAVKTFDPETRTRAYWGIGPARLRCISFYDPSK